MAELTTYARPYAKAVFEQALANHQLQDWAQALATLAAVSGDEKVKALLKSPTLTAADKSALLANLCGEALSVQQKAFIQLLADNKRLSVLPDINRLFLAYKASHEKTLDVEISTAFELDSAWQEKLTQALSAKLNCQVQLTTRLDKTLLGGALVRAGDTVIDGSVRGRLAKLAEAMQA